MPRKRRRLKKKIKLLFTLLAIILIILFLILLINLKPKNNKTKSIINNDKEYISNILSYKLDESLDESLLKWISTNYNKNLLSELNDYLKNNKYDYSIWHKLTGNSLIVLKDLYNKKYDNISNVSINKDKNNNITINFIGDVSLADNWYIAPKYDERNKKLYGILSEDQV